MRQKHNKTIAFFGDKEIVYKIKEQNNCEKWQ